MNRHILLFDGVCNLCNSSVQFIIKRDNKKIFSFASLQSDTGQKLLKDFNLTGTGIYSIVYINDDKCYIKSTAVLHILKGLGGFWKLLFVFIIIPRFIRDFYYDLNAKSRYKLFGKRDSCMIPTPDIRSRFLD